MKLMWPIEDPTVGKLDLIKTAEADYELVVARLGYFPVGLPHDWDIESKRTGSGTRKRNYLVCTVEVLPAADQDAA